MKAILHKIDICKQVALVTFKEWGAYRTHSLVSVFVGPVYFIVQYFIWTAVYGDNTALNGMELAQIIRYFGATALIGYLVMDFADWNLSMLVQTGKYLTFSLRPVHHRFFALSQKLGHRILGFIIEFVPCLLIFTILFKVNMKPDSFFWTILSVALAFLMNFFVNYCLGLLSFWTVRTGGFRNMFGLISSVFSGALIPLVFFPDWLQKVQLFLPFQYTIYVPAMVFTGSYTLGGISLSIPQIVGMQGTAVVIVFLLSELLYRLAMKRFTAVG